MHPHLVVPRMLIGLKVIRKILIAHRRDSASPFRVAQLVMFAFSATNADKGITSLFILFYIVSRILFFSALLQSP